MQKKILIQMVTTPREILLKYGNYEKWNICD